MSNVLTFPVANPRANPIGLSDLDAVIASAAPESLPALVGELARLQALALLRCHSPRQEAGAEDKLLKVEEAAGLLGLSTDALYRRSAKLPFTVRLGPATVRFSESGIRKFIRAREGR